ncbi:electron transfer flavoprotein subunit beta [Alkalihalobacillus alcalophilus ATCC 27647 = CGMCC 1.3604]|uniref:Electron transfer flavoprotein subunit beta n=1 Tax=Alkalihalobacillus alcalophilus ATCC 27647 = CGMCC 1.3604 TaxID=1218173 RepID=A0A094WMQ1_ALKAL|nr:electron transfer flavoprotein subunit beta/FixA family protein [Alkalihalobacillus alcalophilus]KGA98141.1 electron transfer flavoprotein subunit beta [Alkalihalobacillus alcalophilus ATCC 27647 = CGMCC 1.3604]MED1563557.1 electron transfer flavoprotein subunit beta/FixA family protein [Alkalihalobacillus alcalophilus]THG90789.1 electron transfer flavoprotein subunit beta [Alkalihalobacillus alcalophilus ATCC 27647 = CGMCC 1.3604]
MRIFVLLKSTFDTEERVQAVDGKVVYDEGKMIMNPYDEYAIEEALIQKGKHGGEVTVVTVGQEGCKTQLRTALAMGADHAVLIRAEEIVEVDAHSTATLLAAYLADKKADLIIGGNMTVDQGTGQVGPRLAEQLGLHQATAIIALTIDKGMVTVVRDVEGDEVTLVSELPILVTAQQGLNEPKYPTLPGIMKAKKKVIEEVTLDDLSLDVEVVEARTKTHLQYTLTPRGKGKVLEGKTEDQVRQLVKWIGNMVKQV